MSESGFPDILKEHGLDEGWEFARITNTLYYPTLGAAAATVKARLGIPAKANLRDNLPLFELFTVGMAELLAQRKIETEDRQGFEAVPHRRRPWQQNNVANAVKFTEDAGRLPPPA